MCLLAIRRMVAYNKAIFVEKSEGKLKMKIGILTSGGDCPGLNATIRGAAKAIYEQVKDPQIVGIVDGYHGLIHGESH